MSMSARHDRQSAIADASILGAALSIVLLAVVAKAAIVTGAFYVLFPELAALSYDVFTRPSGTWARAPIMLATTPALTAAMGTVVTQVMTYGLWSVAITIAGAILIIGLLRSPIMPSISAAFLPVVFGITSWWYPISIAAVTILLALVSTIYGRVLTSDDNRHAPALAAVAQADDSGRGATLRKWTRVCCFIACLLLVYGLAAATGLRLVLFPPLVMIAFEIFIHGNLRPWAKRPLTLPPVCTITAGVGLAMVLMFGPGPLSVAISLAAGILTLRVLRFHFPPALAVSLLPQIMPQADWRFVLAIAVGTSTLAGVFLLARLRIFPTP
ncbi:HPP family protein [Caballeronia sp. CLC5]|uniref:HPP family protein n=2 Tax=unclassified Caballeronia TaxID=2646786 RepID=UPI001F18C310|nr:HPP family protein [Caballeronia sp. CLC5]MCE4574982.1 HPP family protein [Caballeronia sp. CLC5]